jgi:sterol desaturase/sphingolipid hydroxylase (fatty acid hydroxylase superfamily)
LFGGSVLLMAMLSTTSIGLASAFVATTASLFVVLTGLERVVPYRPAWLVSDGQLVNDLLHGALGSVAGSRLGQLVNDAIVAALTVHIAGAGLVGSPVQTWPFAVQLVVAVVVVDLSRYLQHRLLHRVPWLWRLHRLHHDSTRLTVWKGGRAHVVERIMQSMCMFLPVLLLGFSADVVVWSMAIHSFLGSIAHSNIDIRLGVVGSIINGPEQHRLHHSMNLDEGNSNLGSAFVIFDRLFGTWLDPHARAPVGAIGVAEQTPKGFFAQLVAPFTSTASKVDTNA